MEFLIILIVILVIGGFLAIFILPGLIAGGLLVGEKGGREKRRGRLPAKLDETFDGRMNVVYPVTMWEDALQEDIITGAQERGYRLASTIPGGKGPDKLIFEKQES